MTSAITRALIGDNYEYRLLFSFFTEDEINKYKESLTNKYNVLTKEWDKNKNTEWLLRHYLSIKMILSSSIMLSSLEYINKKNVRIAEPYLLYYSLLTVCRALLFTLPNVSWNNGELIKASHSKILNIISDSISIFNFKKGEEIKNKLVNCRDYRELFSYKFPATGMYMTTKEQIIDTNEAIELATLIAEIAQFNSEQLQNSLYINNKDNNYEVDRTFLMQIVKYNFGNEQLIDSDDRYRLDYIFRKQFFPLNLYWTMTEGMIEDFFGAWCSEEENEELYDPDRNWRIIFSVP